MSLYDLWKIGVKRLSPSDGEDYRRGFRCGTERGYYEGEGKGYTKGYMAALGDARLNLLALQGSATAFALETEGLNNDRA